jgi:hypothetical protein
MTTALLSQPGDERLHLMSPASVVGFAMVQACSDKTVPAAREERMADRELKSLATRHPSLFCDDCFPEYHQPLWISCCAHCGCEGKDRIGHDDTCRFGCNDGEIS